MKELEIREPVKWFTQQMEMKLRENDHKGSWRTCTDLYFITRLWEEFEELADAINNKESKENIIKECAEISNLAMMIADNARHLK